MRIRTFALLLTVVAAPLFASDRYVNEKLNFSLGTPAEWKWQSIPDDASDGVWGVTGPHGDRFSIAVSPLGAYRLSEDWVTEMQRDIRRDAQQHGAHIVEFRHESAGSPIFPSFNYSYVRVERDGSNVYVDGYVAATNRVYTLQYASRDHALVSQFRDFVQSFQIVDRREALRAPAARIGDAFPGARKTGLTAAVGVPLAPNSTTPPPPPTH